MVGSIKGISVSALPVAAMRKGWRRLAIVVEWQTNRPNPHAFVRIPLGLTSSRGVTRRVEAVGLMEGDLVSAVAEVSLAFGDYVLSSEAEGWRGRRVHFRVAETAWDPLMLCGHGLSTPSSSEIFLWRDEDGTVRAAEQRFVMQSCCRDQLAAWRARNEFSLVVYVPTHGSLRVEVDGRRFTVKLGEYLVANPEESGGPADDQSWPVAYSKIILYQSWLRRVRDALGLPRESGPFRFQTGPRPWTPALREAWSMWERTRVPTGFLGVQELRRAACWAFVITLLREHPNAVAHRGEETNIRDPRVREAAKYLTRHAETPTAIAELATKMGKSMSWLNRSFLAAFGMGPRAYFTQRRMEHARVLLQDPSRTVEEVAQMMGYRSSRAIYRMFKRALHRPPGVLRRLK